MLKHSVWHMRQIVKQFHKWSQETHTVVHREYTVRVKCNGVGLQSENVFQLCGLEQVIYHYHYRLQFLHLKIFSFTGCSGEWMSEYIQWCTQYLVYYKHAVNIGQNIKQT